MTITKPWREISALSFFAGERKIINHFVARKLSDWQVVRLQLAVFDAESVEESFSFEIAKNGFVDEIRRALAAQFRHGGSQILQLHLDRIFHGVGFERRPIYRVTLI